MLPAAFGTSAGRSRLAWQESGLRGSWKCTDVDTNTGKRQ